MTELAHSLLPFGSLDPKEEETAPRDPIDSLAEFNQRVQRRIRRMTRLLADLNRDRSDLRERLTDIDINLDL